VGPPDGHQPRFPGYDVTDGADTWDPTTRAVVLGRLDPPGPLRFFTADEARTVTALTDRLLAQDHGRPVPAHGDGRPVPAQDHGRPVPVVPVIDGRLAAADGDGYRYVDLPDDPEAWRRSLAALDDDARRAHGRSFADLDRDTQMDLVEERATDDGSWHGLPAPRVFSLWMRYAAGAFYAHPTAWSEIGFGGPAYPRGYKNLGLDKREPWEVREVDAADPIPWAERAEAARRRHLRRDGSDGDRAARAGSDGEVANGDDAGSRRGGD